MMNIHELQAPTWSVRAFLVSTELLTGVVCVDKGAPRFGPWMSASSASVAWAETMDRTHISTSMGQWGHEGGDKTITTNFATCNISPHKRKLSWSHLKHDLVICARGLLEHLEWIKPMFSGQLLQPGSRNSIRQRITWCLNSLSQEQTLGKFIIFTKWIKKPMAI